MATGAPYPDVNGEQHQVAVHLLLGWLVFTHFSVCLALNLCFSAGEVGLNHRAMDILATVLLLVVNPLELSVWYYLLNVWWRVINCLWLRIKDGSLLPNYPHGWWLSGNAGPWTGPSTSGVSRCCRTLLTCMWRREWPREIWDSELGLPSVFPVVFQQLSLLLQWYTSGYCHP